MTITCLGGFAFFAITAARLGGFTIFTVAATRLGRRASLTAGVTTLGGLAIFTSTSTFSGALGRRTAQGLFAGRHRRITNRHPGGLIPRVLRPPQGTRTRPEGGCCFGRIAHTFSEGGDALPEEFIETDSDGESKGEGGDALATGGLVAPG